MAILAVVFWIASRFFAAAVESDPVELFKHTHGLGSTYGCWSGVFRLLSWLCEGAFIVLMIILIL